MKIIVSGEKKEVEEGLTIAGLIELEQVELAARVLAWVLNGGK